MATSRLPLNDSPLGDAASRAERRFATALPERYRIRGRLRRTAGPPVFLAVDEQNGQLVVIKGGTEAGAAALREADILARLDHPCIIALRERIETADAGFLVIDYIDANSLEMHLAARGGRLAPETLLHLLLPLCDALAHVHARGFLHRDLKPANVLIRPDGSPVMVDFSAARAQAGEPPDGGFSLLSDGYAAPEQYTSDVPEGPWTDVYGLGALAYRALAGEAPLSAPERLEGALMPPAAALAGPEAARLAAAVDRALALDPADRPQSAPALRDLLLAEADAPDQARSDPGAVEDLEPAPTVRVRRRPRRLVAAPMPEPEVAPQRRKRVGRYALGLALALGLAAGATAAAIELRPLYERHVKSEWVVDPGGGGDVVAIGEALRRAGEDALIAIRPGTYAESLVLERPVHLVAALPDEPPVVAPPDGPCLVSGVPRASVSGLALRRGGPEEGAEQAPCVVITGGALRIENSTIANAAGPAIEVRGGAAPEFHDNRIEGGAGAALLISEGAHGVFTGNTIRDIAGPSVLVRSGAAPEISDNAILNSGPVVFADGAAGAFARNRIEDSRASAVEVSRGAAPLVRENTITGTKEAGIFVYEHGGGQIEANSLQRTGLSAVILAGGAAARVTGNTIRESREHGVLVLEGSRAVLEDNTIAGSGGHGIAIAPDAEVELARNRLEGNTDPQLLDARAKGDKPGGES